MVIMNSKLSSIEKAKIAEQAIPAEITAEVIDAFRQSRLCVQFCLPETRKECHGKGMTPEKCTQSTT